MNKKQLFLHIGTQKTGTTTIQSILSKNKKRLQNERIGYLGRFAKLAREMRVINQPNPELEKSIQQAFEKELEQHSDIDLDSFVVSNEKFTGDKMIAYRNSGLIAESLHRILEPFSLDIKIIVFIRRQDKFIESTYAQKVYSGSSLSFSEFIELFDESDFHWTNLLDSYASVFGKENILVHRFDRKYLPQKNSLIHTFGEAIGSDFLRNFSGELIKNQGYSRNTLEIAKLSNKHLDKREMRLLRDILRKADPKTRSYSFFSDKERERFLDIYRSSNKEVAKNYFGDEQLFSEFTISNTNAGNDQKYEGLTPENVAVILSKSLLVLQDDYTKKIKELDSKKTLGNLFRQFLKNIYGKLKNP